MSRVGCNKEKTSDSKEKLLVIVDETKEVNPENKLPNPTITNEEIEVTDEIDHSRRKRRRSSASIE